jgi:DNA replication and repair protein RecF
MPAVAPRAAVRRLALTDFRCYGALRLELDGRPVLLTGPNGAGKTNILEAISFLAPGRGLRRARIEEIDRHHAGPDARWAVAARIETPQATVELGTGREAPAGESGGKRVLRIDGKPGRSQAELARLMALLWVTPEMDRLFQDGASARRRFLDRMVYGLDPDHADRLTLYEHALRERARLLREGPRDPDWLAALEARMAETGIAVLAARRALLRRLEGALEQSETPFPRAGVALEGRIEPWLDEMPALAAEERFAAELAASRPQDGETGGAALGPHRSDLAVRHLPSGLPAALCSTGEQKALLLALVLAQTRLLATERGAAPLLLLDEVGAHLDRVRRMALYDELRALGVQAWLTGADEALFDGLGRDVQHFRVTGGNVVAR